MWTQEVQHGTNGERSQRKDGSRGQDFRSLLVRMWASSLRLTRLIHEER